MPQTFSFEGLTYDVGFLQRGRVRLTVTRDGHVLEACELDLDDLRDRERLAEHLAARHPGPAYLDHLRDIAVALGGGGFVEFLDGGAPSATAADQPPVPSFPLQVLPEAPRRFVEETAHALDAPPDLVAVPLLAIAAGVIGASVTLRITGQWEELPVLWVAVVGEPGSAKSPALQAAQRPLMVLQAKAHADWVQEMERYGGLVSEARATKSKPPPPPPDPEHFFTTDVTIEALARILGSPRSTTPGLVVVVDELAAWVLSFDRYNAQGERQRWLSLWAGMPVKVDRATRDTSFIPRPAVSVCGSLTPDSLPLLEAEAGRQDGFIERILFSFPDSRPMRFVDAPPPRVDLVEVFGALRSCGPGEVEMSPQAKARFAQFVNANAEAQEREAFRPLRRYLAKLPRHLARLALVLHCLAFPTSPTKEALRAATVEAAIELLGYFVSHARRALLHFGEGALARRVLGLLARAGGEMRLGELHQHLSGRVSAHELASVRSYLVASGLIEVVRWGPGPEGGRPGEVWRLRATPDSQEVPPRQKTQETPGQLEVTL